MLRRIGLGLLQPQVGIAQGIGIGLQEVQGKQGCKIESIIQNGVAESEGTLRAGDIIEEVDQIDVKGCLFDEINGLLVGVAGSSVTICGLHAPYTPADAFSAVLVRSGLDRCHPHSKSTKQVEDLSEQALREAGAIRSALLDFKALNKKLQEAARENEDRITSLESEKKGMKQEIGDVRGKYDSQVARTLEMTRGKKKAEDAAQEASKALALEKASLRSCEGDLKKLRDEHEQLTEDAKEMGGDLVMTKNSLIRANESIQSLKEEASEHLKTISAEQTARQKGEVQVAQLAYQLDLAQAKIKNLKDDLKDFENSSARNKEEISDLKALVAQKEKDIVASMGFVRQTHAAVCRRTVGIAKGLGITLHSPEEGVCRIESIIAGGVADQQGSLQVNDVISEVDRVPVADSALDEIQQLLSGPVGSSVAISVLRSSPEDTAVSAILFRSGVDVGSENVQELCTEMVDTVDSLRGEMLALNDSVKDLTERFEVLKADSSRELSRLQGNVDDWRAKTDRLHSKSSELQSLLKTAEDQVSEREQKVTELQTQEAQQQQKLQQLTGVHEQQKVSLDEMKAKISETVKDLEDAREKLAARQGELKDAVRDRNNIEKVLEDQVQTSRRLERHLDSEQALSKTLRDEIARLKDIIEMKDKESGAQVAQLAHVEREKDEAKHTVQTLSAELKDGALQVETLGREVNEMNVKLSRESERATELTLALDRASDLENKTKRQVSDMKRKLDAEVFAKDQALRREEATKRSLNEAREYAADFKTQAETEISHLRKEVVSICGSSQKTHAKVCGQVVGSAAGVGLFLVDSDSEGGGVKVDSVVPGRSASLDGRVAPGDEILEIDGENVSSRRAEYVNSLLAGETGSSVTVKAQKGDGQGAYLATFVRSSAKSRCMNSEDVSELCRDVEVVQESLKSELLKLREKVVALEKRNDEERELAARDHAQLSAQVDDSQAKLSCAVQKCKDTAKLTRSLEEELAVKNEQIGRLSADLDAARLNQTTVEQVRRGMEKKMRHHEVQLRHWAKQQAAVLRDNCNDLTETFHDIESRVLDTASNNVRLANELDGLQVMVSKIEPQLEASLVKIADRDEQITSAQDRIRQLEHECRLHKINRGDILAQLQDSLMREADLRESVAHTENERGDLKHRLADAESQNGQLDLKLKRVQEQARLLESKLSDARDLDHARQQELASIERKLVDSSDKFTSQISKLSRDLDLAYNVACHMHTAVCRPQGTSHRSSATEGCTTVLPDHLREVKTVVSALYADVEKFQGTTMRNCQFFWLVGKGWEHT